MRLSKIVFPTFRERLNIWQELLNRRNGVSSEMETAIAGEGGLSAENAETLRQDKKRIKDMLGAINVELIDKKRNGIHYFSLPSAIDLVHLYYKHKSNKPTKNIPELITKMHGFLPEKFLSELLDTYRDIIENDRGNEQVITFEKDCEMLADMRFFSSIYKAINRNALYKNKHRQKGFLTAQQVILKP